MKRCKGLFELFENNFDMIKYEAVQVKQQPNRYGLI